MEYNDISSSGQDINYPREFNNLLEEHAFIIKQLVSEEYPSDRLLKKYYKTNLEINRCLLKIETSGVIINPKPLSYKINHFRRATETVNSIADIIFHKIDLENQYGNKKISDTILILTIINIFLVSYQVTNYSPIAVIIIFLILVYILKYYFLLKVLKPP